MAATLEQKARARASYLANRDARLAKAKAYALAHPEEVRAYKRAHEERHRARIKAEKAAKYQANKEARRAQSRAAYDSNPELWKQRAKAYRAKHPEKAKAAVVAWCRANAGRLREIKRAYWAKRQAEDPTYGRAGIANRRARKRNARCEERIDFKAVWKRANGYCGICQMPLGDSPYHFDHIVPLARGGEHSTRNLQVAHATCNLRKGARVA